MSFTTRFIDGQLARPDVGQYKCLSCPHTEMHGGPWQSKNEALRKMCDHMAEEFFGYAFKEPQSWAPPAPGQ